ncbi:hypothetical protein GLOIN_2v1487871 [Rhizophagus irregularis DAOM 181602=DAOM 197198]|uniref:BTB domain-containing protein n=1 Tax=Rhizophagus irregularis (strain DAOM 181602 / DAOM 197198 / MUCL 43194) TaxID=747089 RepID=A0A2P4P1W3_RHIID|nr:hypothetical protein GLOIN_2v1487871 [Rhizophagus irregularis DAOM 181602=DAOM 197198]POG59383.1 hypothetical protein GLOIN_2v1487871 [Rhizophagus irregularis DAOM 181602=DAOM 197198]|eukprot:XP_025166249.1 hypothetical protein GLOIN_2v1487871 [Rhizophagus irregularis DAOM 181602=DAOM 197198]
MSSKFWAELSNDYEKLFETEIGYDVIIYAGEEQYVKEIHAHSNILSIRSQYFRSAFSNEWAEKKDGKFILKKPNISPQLFNIIPVSYTHLDVYKRQDWRNALYKFGHIQNNYKY